MLMKILLNSLLLLPIAVVAGCANSPSNAVPSSSSQPWQAASDARGNITLDAAPTATQSTFVLPSNQALTAMPISADIDPKHHYTLPELIDLAQLNNPDTRIAWASAKHAASAIDAVHSTYLPQVSASVIGALTRSDSSAAAYGLGASNRINASGTLASLTLTWLLYDFGKRDAVSEAAQQAAIAANVSFNGTHQRIIYEVSLAYYRYAAAQHRAKSNAQLVKNAAEVEAAAIDRYKRGIGTVMEKAQARQASAQAHFAAAKADGELRNAEQALLAIIGISPLSTLKVASLPNKPLPKDVPALSDAAVMNAVASRPEVLSAYAAEQAAAAAVKAAQANFKPNIFGAASGTYGDNDLGLSATPAIGPTTPTFNASGERTGLVALIGINIPLYDGAWRSSTVRQAQATAEKASAALSKIRLEAIRQVALAHNEVTSSLAAYEAAKEVLAASQVSLDAATAMYRKGIGSVTAATTAASALLSAENAASDAYSAAMSALVSLTFATGQLGTMQ
jgi:outer membrane protein TolC